MKDPTRRIYAFGLVLVSALLVGVCALLLVFPKEDIEAQVAITVTTTFDEYWPSGRSRGCSLREAIEAINTGASFGGCANATGLADTIEVPAGIYTLTRLAAGDFFTNGLGSLYPVSVDVTIRGAGPDQTIISTRAAFDDRVFHIRASDDPPEPARHVLIEGMTIQGGNTSEDGGGIKTYMFAGNGGSTLTLIDVVLRDNHADNEGGGLFSSLGPSIVLHNVAITGNRADFGGGIYFARRYNIDKLVMTNVTLSDNEAQTSGGGLYAGYGSYLGAGAVVRATHVTFADNQAGVSGGSIYNKDSTVYLWNTIVARGTASGAANNCAGDPKANITSLGYNFDSGLTCGLQVQGKAGDLWSQDPMLDPLGDYGGGTLTHRLQPTSPALDHIPSDNGCGVSVTTDQRGVPRPQPAGGMCDVGAHELGRPVLSIDKSVTPDSDVAYGGTVTYTIVLDNSGTEHGENVTLSDTLPAEVDFSVWVQRPAGADVANQGLSWTGTVEAGKPTDFVFVVSHVGDYGDVVTNTAAYDHAAGGGSDDATFTVAEFAVNLPVVLRNLHP
jgi:uncharacterized repeat protein (TIGR01451 family)/CSLREA domain-containing protein